MREKVWPKREKITGNWRKLHSEELQGYYSSSNTPTYYSNNEITLVRPRRRWRWKLKEREHLYDLGVDGRTILKLYIQEIEREESDGCHLSEDHTGGRLSSRRWWHLWNTEGDELWTSWATLRVSNRCDPSLIHWTSTEIRAQYMTFLVYVVYCVQLS